MRGPGADQSGELRARRALLLFLVRTTDHLPLPFADLLTRPTFPFAAWSDRGSESRSCRRELHDEKGQGRRFRLDGLRKALHVRWSLWSDHAMLGQVAEATTLSRESVLRNATPPSARAQRLKASLCNVETDDADLFPLMPSSFVGCANIATLPHRDAVRRRHSINRPVSEGRWRRATVGRMAGKGSRNLRTSVARC